MGIASRSSTRKHASNDSACDLLRARVMVAMAIRMRLIVARRPRPVVQAGRKWIVDQPLCASLFAKVEEQIERTIHRSRMLPANLTRFVPDSQGSSSELLAHLPEWAAGVCAVVAAVRECSPKCTCAIPALWFSLGNALQAPA